MIQANCRNRFTGDDFLFIIEALARKSATKKTALSKLLTEPDERDTILDDESLFAAIAEKSSFNRVSPYLYFYILTRRAFLQRAVDDRELTDYVACMLAHFCCTGRAHSVSHQHEKSYHYIVDMMSDSMQASSFEAFLIRSHIGNYALFMTGLFPDRIYYKSTYGRRAPGFDYYERMGSSSYHWASRHRLAPKFSLVDILGRLSANFRTMRIALNHMADKHLNLNRQPPGMDQVMRQILFGSSGPAAPEV